MDTLLNIIWNILYDKFKSLVYYFILFMPIYGLSWGLR